MSAKHTPTPFLHFESLVDAYFEDLESDGEIEELKEAKSDWIYIHRAVNSHEALLSAAKSALQRLLQSGIPGNGVISKLQQAIAQAEGRS